MIGPLTDLGAGPARKLIVRTGFGRDTDAVSGFVKTHPVFSTDDSKHQFVRALGVDDRRRLKRVSWITFSRSGRAVDQMTPVTGQPLSRERSELLRAWTGFDLPLMFVQTIATEKDANRDRSLHE